MQKFLADNVLPILESPEISDQEIKKQKLQIFEAVLKIFVNAQVKVETSSINKQMAKKSRELFILSADNESLKQNIEQLQTSNHDIKSQYSMLDQQKTKQKMIYERQIAEIKKQNQNKEKLLRNEINKIKNEKQLQIQQFGQKIREIKRQHKKQLDETIDNEKKIQQEAINNLTSEFQQQKAHIIKDNNDKKKQLIRKYEDKINKTTGQYEDKIYLLQKEIQEIKKENSKAKTSMQDKMMIMQGDITKLKGQLKKETSLHNKYEQLYRTTNEQLSKFQEKAANQKQSVEQELHETKKKLYQQQRKYIKDTTNLNKQLETTILEKDKRYTDTVEIMETERRTQVDSLRNEMLEQRQIAVNAVEVMREEQNYQNQLKYNKLKNQHEELKVKYTTVSEDYEAKIKSLLSEHEQFVEGLNMRKQYELNISGLNSERESRQLKHMHDLKVKSLHERYANQLAQLQKKNNEDKLGLTNKLTTQYQSMISDIRNSNDIQIKQKLIQFERKAKGYQNKLKDADKKKAQLKSQIERVKMEMQMRIDSMLQVTETLQQQISSLNEKNQDFQREMQKVVNEYQLKILMMNNEVKKTIQEYESREEEMKEVLESKLKAKNQQIVLMSGRLKRETNQLIERNAQRVKALQKEYSELKRVLGQKTSLPEDVEALKVFHAAYIEKEEQLIKQRKKIEFLRRELMAKDAIDKVFAEKGERIIFETNSKNLNAFNTYQVLNSSKKNQKSTFFGAFKSTQIF